AAWDRAVKRLDALEKRLAQPLPKLPARKPAARRKPKVTHRSPKKDYLRAVEKTKEYIRAGDVFQAVLSQRFDVDPGVDSFQVYRALRMVNPSPYMFFLRFAPEEPLRAAAGKARKSSKKAAQSIELARSSPELLVRVHQGK